MLTQDHLNSNILDQLSKIANVVDTFEEKLVGVQKSFAELKVENEYTSTTVQTHMGRMKSLKHKHVDIVLLTPPIVTQDGNTLMILRMHIFS